MKQTFLIISIAASFLTTAIEPANAQFSENHAIYLSGEVGGGNYFNTDLNLNYVFKESYSFTFVRSGIGL